MREQGKAVCLGLETPHIFKVTDTIITPGRERGGEIVFKMEAKGTLID